MRRKCIYAAMAALFVAAAGRADDWPQWLGPTRNSVWHETGILAKFPEGGPKSFGVRRSMGDSRGQPSRAARYLSRIT